MGLMSISAVPTFGQAQQVPIPEQPSVAPQIEIAGTGVGTLELGRSRNAVPGGGRASGSQVNISDSSLLLGAAERLYNGGIGSVTFGQLAYDQSNVGKGTPLFLYQAYADYQTQALEAYIGRTDQPTAQVVTFPTIRGDDLVTFTNLLDPFSVGDNTEEHRYANVAAVTLNQNLTTFENFHVQHLIDSGSSSSDTGLNSYGLSVQRLGLPGLDAIQKVISYGGGYEHRSVGRGDGGRSEALYAGGVGEPEAQPGQPGGLPGVGQLHVRQRPAPVPRHQRYLPGRLELRDRRRALPA